jgi:molybdopterin converting factor small subunit
MARVILSGEARRFTGNVDQLDVDAKNVIQLFRQLGQRFPELAPILESGFAVAIDGEMYEDALLQPIKPDSEVILVPKIAGGARA